MRAAALALIAILAAACSSRTDTATRPTTQATLADAHAPAVATSPPAPPATAMAAPAAVAALPPIFDTHVHYSIGAWAQYTPAQIVERLSRANVVGALVSSSPDDGTLMLQAADPARIYPVLRPYHGDVNSGNWSDDPLIVTYLEQRMGDRDYLGVGEFHVTSVEQARSDVVRRVVRLATERGMFVQVHGAAEVVRALLAQEPQARVFWAHMGMSDSAETVMALLDEHPNVWTDTSYRDGEIAPGGALNPAWRATLTKHADRILLGSDTWVPSRWDSYEQIIASHRAYLALLPGDVAEKIAWRNAARMFSRP